MGEFRIRDAKVEDCNLLRDLILELGAFENMLHLHHVTEQMLVKDGFQTSPPVYYAFLYEVKLESGDWFTAGYTIFSIGFCLRYRKRYFKFGVQVFVFWALFTPAMLVL